MALIIALFAVIAGNVYILKLPYDTKIKLLRIQGVTIFEGIIFCGSYIIWQTVKSALHWTRSTIRKICLSLLAVYLFISNTCMFSVLFLMDTNPHWYSMLSFICFGIFAQLIFAVWSLKGLFLMLRVIARIGLIKLHRRKGSDQCGPDFIPSRLGRVSLLLVFLYSVAVGLYGVQQAWKPPNVVMVNFSLPRFPNAMNGLRVLQIADIHLGETVGRKTVQDIVNIAQDLQPGKRFFLRSVSKKPSEYVPPICRKVTQTVSCVVDMIVLVGDLVDGRVDELKFAAEPLKELSPPKGKYFVTGRCISSQKKKKKRS